MQPAQIYSRINYGIEVYGKCAASYMSKIQTLQNKLMKMLLQLNYSTPTDDLHAILNILKVNDMFKTEILSFVNFFMYHQCFMIISNIRRLTMITPSAHESPRRDKWCFMLGCRLDERMLPWWPSAKYYGTMLTIFVCFFISDFLYFFLMFGIAAAIYV